MTTTKPLGILPGQDILCLLATAGIPEVTWEYGDDLCDCTFQRIGTWSNPYIARTMRVRLCCIWMEIYKEFPEYVQEIPASWNENTKQFDAKPIPWNAEDADMPTHLWHRQVAVELGIPLSQARKVLAGKQPPKAVKGTGVRMLKETKRE